MSLTIVVAGCTLPEEGALPLEEGADAAASDGNDNTGTREDADREGADASVSASKTGKGATAGSNGGDSDDESEGASDGAAASKAGGAGAGGSRMSGSAGESGQADAEDGAGPGGKGGSSGSAAGEGSEGMGSSSGGDDGTPGSGSMASASGDGMSGASAEPGGSMMSEMPAPAGEEAEMPPECEPSEETCDGQDNDCDEQIDEDVPPMPCGNATPPCKQGAKVCTNGEWSRDCPGEVGPSREVCDGVDNDCDGDPDEDCDCVNGAMMECGASSMTPCRKGMKRCVNGKWPSTCEGEIAPEPERCDGLDNDCDGNADDGGDGLCGTGQHCAGRDMCVACTRDSHCTGRAPVCQEFYCDTSSNTCETREANEGSSCNGGGTCRDGSCCTPRCAADQCGGDDTCGGSCDRDCGTDQECVSNRCRDIPKKGLYDSCTAGAGQAGDCGPGFVCIAAGGGGPHCMAAQPCAANADFALGLFCAEICYGDPPPADGIRPNGRILGASCPRGTFCWENNFTESDLDGWCVPD